MNHIYRIVFNHSLGLVQVVSEFARSGVKCSCRGKTVGTKTDSSPGKSGKKRTGILKSYLLNLPGVLLLLTPVMTHALDITSGGGNGGNNQTATSGLGGLGGVAGGGGGAGGNGPAGSGGSGATTTANAQAGTSAAAAGSGPGGAAGAPGLNAGGGGGGAGQTTGAAGSGGAGASGTVSTSSDSSNSGNITGGNGNESVRGGGGGASGALVLTAPGATFVNGASGSITGGNGGTVSDTAFAGAGGGGGAGLVLMTGGIITNQGVISGGQGGGATISYGGQGGAGLFLFDGGTLDNQAGGQITGGAGGINTNTANRDGDGGGGVLSNRGTIVNSGAITGGAVGPGGTGGIGGNGITANGGSILNNAGAQITGGGGVTQGGVGISLINDGGATLTNLGTISGGAGSAKTGVNVASDNNIIINGGAIIGTGGANAITLSGNSNTVGLLAGYGFTGNVVANGSGNILSLGGDADGSFDVSQIGVSTGVFQGFNQYHKTGDSIWQLVNTTAALTPWTLSGGTLQISADGNLGATAGGLTFDGGILQLTGATTLSAARAVNITANNGTLDTLGFNATLAGLINGPGGLTKEGGGTLTLTGDNTYAGNTIISQGTLQLGNGSATGSIVGDVINNGTLAYEHTNNISYGGNISGAGAVNQNGAGTLTLTGDNTYTGGTIISQGTLQLGNGSDTGSIVGDIINNGALIFNHSNNISYTGAISGSGAVSQNGTGTLALSGINSYTGGTSITAGTLSVTQGNALGTGAVTNNAALALNFAGDGTLANVLAGNGSLIKTGAGNTTLTADGSAEGDVNVNAGTLTLAQTGNFSAANYTTANGAATAVGSDAQLTLTGSLTQDAGSTLAVVIGNNLAAITAGSATLDGTLILTGYAAQPPLTASALTSTLYTVINTTGGISGDFSDVDLNFAGSAVDYLTVAGKKSTDNLLYQVGYGLTWQSGPTLGNGAFTLVNADDSFNVDVALADESASATGWNGQDLTKDGDGTLTLSAVNTYTGATLINQGTLETAIADAFAQSSQIVVNSGATLALDGNNQTANQLSGAGNIALDDATLTANNDNGEDSLFGGVISGAGSLDKTGAGVLMLTGDNTFTGGTVISQGILQLGNGSGTGSIVGNVLNNGILAFDRSNEVSFDGIISGDGAVDQNGTGTLTLTGDSTYTGGTVINQGTLQLGNGSSSGSIAGNILNNGTLAFNRSNDVSYGGIISGSGAVDQSGTGTLTLTGDNTYTGGTVISQGTLQLGNGSGTGSIVGDITNHGTLIFNHGNNFGYDGIISGTGAVSQNGTATLTLTGINTYTGGTHINTGSLTATQGNALGTGVVTNDSTLTLDFTGDGALANVLAGNGSLIKTGAGNATLTAGGSGEGDVSVNAGILTLAQTGNFSAANYVTANGAATAIGPDAQLLLTGSLTQQAGATLQVAIGDNTPAITASSATLNGALVLTGFATEPPLTASALTGTLYTVINTTNGISGDFSEIDLDDAGSPVDFLTVAGNISTDNLRYQVGYGLTWQAGSTLGNGVFTLVSPEDDFNVDVALTNQLASTTGWNGQDLTKNGAGTLTLSAVNTYTGATLINQGTLETTVSDAFAQSSQIVVNSGATLAMDGNNQTANQLSGAGNITLGDATLTANNDNGEDSLFGGVISGAGSLDKSGDGTLTLTGDNIYAGGTVISQGTLQLGNGSGTGSIIGDVSNNGTLIFNHSNDLSYGGIISGDGAVDQNGTGTLTLTGDNTYTGPTTIATGTLQLGNGGTAGSLTGNIDNNGTLIFNRSDDTTYAGVLSGNGSLIKTGAGNATLTASGSAEGDVNVNAGTLTLAQTGNFSAANYTTANGATTAIGPDAQLVLSGNLTQDAGATLAVAIGNNAPAVNAASASLNGTLILTGYAAQPPLTASALTGTLYTVINTTDGISGDFSHVDLDFDGSPVDFLTIAGNISTDNLRYQVGYGLTWQAGSTLGNGIFTLANAGDSFNVDVALDDESASATGWNGQDLTKNGDGTLTLSAANTYTGATFINQGTLETAIADAFAQSSQIVVNSGATLALDDNNQIANQLSGAGNITLGDATLTANNASGAESTFSGSISGAGSLDKTGAGILMLTGDSTFTGGTVISQGTLQLGNGSSTGSIAGNVLNHGTLAFNRSDDVSFDGIISGDGAVDQNGSGTLTLTGDSTYTGGTVISQGTLQLGNGSGTGSIAGDISNNGTLIFNRSNEVSYGGIISGDGAVTQNGIGTLTLTGDNTYTGPTTIAAGTLQLGNGGTAGGLTGDIDNNGALILNRGDNITYAGVLSGNGSLIKTGAGNTTLTAGGSAEGDVNVNAGTLTLAQTGNFSAANYATANGAATAIGPDAQLVLTGELTQDVGATLAVAIGNNAPAVNAASASLNGTLILTDYAAQPPLTASALTSTLYTVINTTNGISGDFSHVDLDFDGSPVDFLTIAGNISTDNLRYQVGYGLTWLAGSTLGNGAFTLVSPEDDFNIDVVLANQSASATGWNGQDLTKNGAGTLTLSAVNTYTGATLINQGILETAVSDAFAQSSQVIVNSGATLALNGNDQQANQLSGAGDINLGNAILTANNNSGDSTFSGSISGAGSLDKTGTGILTLTGFNTYTGGTHIDTGSLTATQGNALGTGVVTNDAALTLDFAGDGTLANVLAGNGALIKTGAGNATLTAGGSGEGDVSVNAGTLTLAQTGNFSAANYATANGAATAIGPDAQLVLTGSLTQQAGATLQVAIGNNAPAISAASATLNGTLVITGFATEPPLSASALAGTLYTVINTTNGISGDFSEIDLDDAGSPVDFLTVAGNISTDNLRYQVGYGLTWQAGSALGNGTFDLVSPEDDFNVDVALTNQSVSARGWNGQDLTKDGAGTLTFSAVNTYTGATLINQGTLKTAVSDTFAQSSQITVNSGATLAMDGNNQTANRLSGAGDITLGTATLTANNASINDSLFGGMISGAGSLDKTGAGILTLTGDNIYAGGTVISQGTLQLGNGSSTGSIAGNVLNNGALAFVHSNDLSYGGIISGDGAVDQNGTGTLTLIGDNTYTGGTHINTGSLTIAQSNALGTGLVTNHAALTLDFAGDGILNNVLAGSGTLIKTGAGNATLTAGGSAEGDINVDAGTLTLAQTGNFSAANYTISDGAATAIGSSAQLALSGNLTQDAGTTLAVAIGNNTPAISAASASLNGTLVLAGFATQQPQTASALTSTLYTVINTTGGISGDFDEVDLGFAGSAVDFLTVAGKKSSDNLLYQVGYGLTWQDGPTLGNGTFTLGTADDSFNVDVVLANQSASTTGWNGQDLSKNGAGTLTLSAVNAYTGATLINQGTLDTAIADAFAHSSQVIVNSGATLALDGNNQIANRLSGAGNITLGDATLTGNNASGADSTFGGVISGAGSLDKTGAGTLTLTGDNTFTGGTHINTGSLTITQGNALGVGVVTNHAALTLDFATDGALNNSLAGSGALIKTGAGNATLTAGGSAEGDINVNAGTLTLAQTGNFSAANYATADGAATAIGPDAQLVLTGSLTQDAGATLQVAIGDNAPAITANSATLDGTLVLAGFAAQSTLTASALTSTLYTVVDTTGGISGDFDEVDLGDAGSPVDFLTVAGKKSTDNLLYQVGFGLTWQAGSALGNGAFTLGAAADSFNVDVVLADESASATGWNGQDLTKNGAGTLTLSAVNTYTGATLINQGTLDTAIADAFAHSSQVIVNSGATLALDGNNQIANRLSGAGNIALGDATLTGNNASGADSTFGGVISGAGGLDKTGAGTLTLTGNNAYTGGTTITNGILAVGNGGTSGNLTGDIDNNGTLIFNRSDDMIYAGVLNGNGALIKTGAGNATLTAGGSAEGDINVNAGTLTLAQTGNFSAANYATADGAATAIGPDAQLVLTGSLTQDAGATLQVAIGDNAPAITANSATLDGTLVLAGFAAQSTLTASALTSTLYTVVDTTGGISGDFDEVDLGDAGSPVDFLTVAGKKSTDNLLYQVGFGLTWQAGSALGNGAFTLGAAADSFNVDVVLADESASATGWNGQDLTKNGAGTLTLSAVNTYTGATLINQGTLDTAIADAFAHSSQVVVNSGATLALDGNNQQANQLSGAGNIALGDATLTANNAGNIDSTFSGSISGAGGLDKTGAGTLTLTGNNAYTGGTTITNGILAVGNGGTSGNLTGNIDNNGTLIFNRSDDITYDGVFSGNGVITKSGDGSLIISGDSDTYSGDINIQSGRLVLDDSAVLGGNVNVLEGTTLAGTGTAGNTVVYNGGIILPGNAGGVASASADEAPGLNISTMSINGHLRFQEGSKYQVTVNPEGTESDLIHVTGQTQIDGGTVQIIGKDGAYRPSSTYTILTSGDGVVGTFDGVTSNYAFLTPSLTYDANNVMLTLLRNSLNFADDAITFNQRNAANGLQSVGSGDLYDAIASLTSDSGVIPAALDQISGEFYASVKSALIEDSRFVREAANNRLLSAYGHASPATQAVTPGANEDDVTTWGQIFGSWGSTGGNDNAARLDRRTSGVLLGGDKLLKNNWRAGVMGGLSHTNLDVDERNSSGSSNNYHLGIYGGNQWDKLAFRSALAYSRYDIDTDRYPRFSDFSDHVSGNYRANIVQAFGELAYTLQQKDFSLEPFANLTYLNLHTNGFIESGGTAALNVHSDNHDATFSTLGLRSSTDVRLGGAAATLTGMLGWRHSYGSNTPTSTQSFTGGNSFTVEGVPIAKDAAVIETGIAISLPHNTKMGLSYNGQFGDSGSRDQRATATINWQF